MNKICLFSDQHIHNFTYSKINSLGENELLETSLRIIIDIFRYCETNNIKDIYFLGDMFHARNSINTEVYCTKVFKTIRDCVKTYKTIDRFYILAGNHDILNVKGDTSLEPFKEIPRVYIVDEPISIPIYTKNVDRIIMVPFKKDINDVYTYLENTKCTSNDLLLIHQLISNTEFNSTFKSNEFFDVDKFKYKRLFSGHTHHPFDIEAKRVVNIGSPMQHNFGDRCVDSRGFVVYDLDTNEYERIPTTYPKFTDDESDTDASYIRKNVKCSDFKSISFDKQDKLVDTANKYVEYKLNNIKYKGLSKTSLVEYFERVAGD